MTSTEGVPRAALYYFPKSIYAAVALLALAEKGYGDDEVDLKFVDLSKGENYAPSFLRLNPKATVPTLVVPIEKTLQADMDVRFKALSETRAIVDFLDKSRTSMSRTHTTSSAPAMSLAPATVAFQATSNALLDVLYAPAADPNVLFFLQARTPAELTRAAGELRPFLAARRAALGGHLAAAAAADADPSAGFAASAKTRAFWAEKLAATDAFLVIFERADAADADLSAEERAKREDYFAQAKAAWEVGLREALVAISNEMIGPLALGDQVSIADLHLGPWLARVAALSGAQASDSGGVAIAKIEAHVGGGFSLPRDFAVPEAQRTPTAGTDATAPPKQAKLAAFWDTFRERPSWQKVYADGLH